jgi:hypothetical protein
LDHYEGLADRAESKDERDNHLNEESVVTRIAPNRSAAEFVQSLGRRRVALLSARHSPETGFGVGCESRSIRVGHLLSVGEVRVCRPCRQARHQR